MTLSKKNLFFALVLIASIFSSCKKEIAFNTVEDADLQFARIENHMVNLEQAKVIAVLNSVYPNGVRDFKKKAGKQVLGGSYSPQKQQPGKAIKNTFSIKNGEAVPSLYIINYKEGGFVIVSGDDRMLPILAHSEKGEFLTADPKELNPGVNIWLKANLKYISALRNGKLKPRKEAALAWTEMKTRSQLMLNNNVVLSFPPCGAENEWDQYGEVDTVLLATATWGQQAPFNASIPWNYTYNCRPVVGCVAVATSIVMRYHQFPSGPNWSSMPMVGSSSATENLLWANHFYTGTGANSCTLSTATYTNSEAALEYHGYSTNGFDDFDIIAIGNNIRQGLPVILRGVDGTLGHQWVAAGVNVTTQYWCVQADDEDPPVEYRNPPPPSGDYRWDMFNYTTEFYMNWGWAGAGPNGWFNAYVWNPGYDNYDSGMKMLTGIHP